jgi:hypothetical protein
VNIPGVQLTWSNGATGNPISVSTTTAVTATRTVNGCTSGNSNSITPAPNNTPTFTVCLVNPTLCNSNGSVTINASGSGLQYSIDNGATWSDNPVFSPLASGSVTGIKVKNGGGCISAPQDCSAESSCQQRLLSKAVTAPVVEEQTTSIKAFPNPFNDKVKFVITSGQAGNGSLDVYNTMGQKIKTVFQGHLSAGVNNFELRLPNTKTSNLIYRFVMDQKRMTGKLLQLNQ